MPAEKPETANESIQVKASPDSIPSESSAKAQNPGDASQKNGLTQEQEGTESKDSTGLGYKQRLFGQFMLLTVMSDAFSRVFFRDQKELVQNVLRILTGNKTLILSTLTIQKDLKHLIGSHSVVLDICATAADGAIFDLEIDSKADRMTLKRILYYFCALVTDSLRPRDSYQNVPPVTVAAIINGNIFSNKDPVNQVSLFNTVTNQVIAKLLRWIIVDSNDRRNTAIGHLMHDFCCAKASDMYYPFMAKRMRELKETERGRQIMNEAIEQILKEYAAQATAGVREEAVQAKEEAAQAEKRAEEAVAKAQEEAQMQIKEEAAKAKEEAARAKEEAAKAKEEAAQAKEEAEKRVALAEKKAQEAAMTSARKTNSIALYLLKMPGANLTEISKVTGLNLNQVETLQKQLHA